MVNLEYYSLADLTRMAGIKRRTIQNWAACGALLAEEETERQGSGTHRIFSRDEAIIALILSRLPLVSPPIGRLRFIAAMIRKHLATDGWGRDVIEQTIRGERSTFLAVYSDGQVSLNPKDEADQRRIFNTLWKGNELVVIVLLDNALGALRS